MTSSIIYENRRFVNLYFTHFVENVTISLVREPALEAAGLGAVLHSIL